MRTIFIVTVLLLTAAISNAQLVNTKWEGKMNVPDETEVILNFKNNSVEMIIADNDVVGETMSFSIKDSVIIMKKTSGNSPCNVGDEFKVKFTIKGDKLFISNLFDPCDPRSQSWSTKPFIRVKE